MKRPYQILCLLSALLFTVSAFAAPIKFLTCETQLSTKTPAIELQAFNTTISVIVPSVLPETVSIVTYTLPVILRGLRMSEKTFDQKFAGKRVLLVGEGFGVLMPKLLSIGADAVAIDPLYSLKLIKREDVGLAKISDRSAPTETIQGLLNYIERYGDRLTPGVSDNLPFADGTFDNVISHKVITNFVKDRATEPVYDWDLIRKTITESARMLKPGGQALHVFDDDSSNREFRLGADGFLDPADYAPAFDVQLSSPLRMVLRYSQSNGGYSILDGLNEKSEHLLLTVSAKK